MQCSKYHGEQQQAVTLWPCCINDKFFISCVQSLIEELMISQNNEALAMFISFCCLCLTQAQSAIVARLTFSVTRAFGSDLCDRFFRQTRTWDSCLETIFVGDDSLLTYYVYSSEYDRYFCSADLPPSSVIYICISNCV